MFHPFEWQGKMVPQRNGLSVSSKLYKCEYHKEKKKCKYQVHNDNLLCQLWLQKQYSIIKIIIIIKTFK